MSDTAGASRQTPPREIYIVAAGSTAAALTVTGGAAGELAAQVNVMAVGGDLHMRFGRSDVPAADTDDWLLPENTERSYYVSPSCNYVSIVGSGAALRWHVSS